ncbi:hypothetical protein Tco_0920144 [Tanacetum coccineum]
MKEKVGGDEPQVIKREGPNDRVHGNTMEEEVDEESKDSEEEIEEETEEEEEDDPEYFDTFPRNLRWLVDDVVVRVWLTWGNRMMKILCIVKRIERRTEPTKVAGKRRRRVQVEENKNRERGKVELRESDGWWGVKAALNMLYLFRFSLAGDMAWRFRGGLCMQTRSSSKFVGEPSTNPTSTNPKRRNRRRSKQRVEPFALEETPVVTMADQRTMAELLRAPTEGYAEAIVVPPIPAEHFELKHSLINLVTSKQFFGFEKEDPHAHIRYFNKITSTLKYKDVPETSIKLMLFSIDGPARIWLDKEPPRSILTWDDLVSKFINHFSPPSKTMAAGFA